MRPTLLLATIVSLAGCAYALADIDQPLVDRDIAAIQARADTTTTVHSTSHTTETASTKTKKHHSTETSTASVKTTKSKGAAP
ncbi:hypothetical protein CC79DRAFT_1331560, partial [Sarocladium strictum]